MLKILFLFISSFLSLSNGGDMYASDDDGDDDRIYYKSTPTHTFKFNIYNTLEDCKVNKYTDQFVIDYDEKCSCFDNKTVCMKKIIDSESFINTNWSKYTNHLNISKCLLQNDVINKCFYCNNNYIYIFDQYDDGKCQMIGIIIVVFLLLFIILLCVFLVRFLKKIMTRDVSNAGYRRINSDTKIRIYKKEEL